MAVCDARDNGVMGLVNGRSRSKGELCKRGAQNATVCKFRFCSTVEFGKMYYSVGWLFKIVSTSRIHGIHQMHVVVTESLPAFAMVLGYLLKISIIRAFPS